MVSWGKRFNFFYYRWVLSEGNMKALAAIIARSAQNSPPKPLRCIALAAFVLLTALPLGAESILFTDPLTTLGTTLDLTKWTTETGPASFLGRTQLADWISPGARG